ncbi:TMV resistance protein N-like isoform X2 [Quercus lobata]|uniref:TMV resistance protein N-like isoform X2 n=1 Tax=Quercus lobata TaxID=97700 RepID=UPI001245BCF9|nr:TMV resistance protein N-like isoform X2 [Quercus lobata]XP_030933583.1 TMV resistance protein N-like isoform X2 [Quercus lobata]
MALMVTESSSSSSPSSSSTSGCNYEYDAFLSFRGAETRKTFTDHLYTALNKKSIYTFRDDEQLERGTSINEELSKAIKKSRFAIVILSNDYASSSWCLTELADIVECMEMKKLTVLPVFHYVDPSDVRNQTGTFAEAFAKHEERFKETIADVEKWRVALTKVANAAGWDLRDQYQAKVIEKIVGEILGKLKSTSSIVPSDLVGINSRMEKLENLLDMGLKDTLLMGIWGMGGMGKTTLVEVVHGRFLNHFEGNSFLANVREQGRGPGLVSLQKKLLSDILIGRSIDFSNVHWGREEIRKRLSHKKVLIILDDVDHPKQLEALVGDKNWFGPGSRIIITTRDQQLLIKLGVDKIYQIEELNNNEALKLFSRKAFKNDSPLEGYEELSQEFIDYAKGVPLALEVLGSSLPEGNVGLWKSTLDKIEENPPKGILEVLQISFDGLEESEKNVFLDIACFFNREYKINILQTLHDQLDTDIDVLLKKSLITISGGYLQMHDLLQKLGRVIVRRESIEEAGRRSRVWSIKDVFHVLKENTGTDLVTGIFLNAPPKNKEQLNAKVFSNMKNLRLLKLSNVHLPQGLNYLPSKLRYIHWDGYTSESLPTIFEPKELVELIMPCSLMKRLWKGIKDPCIPGRRTFAVNIPEWAIEQNEEASEYTQLHVKLDDNWNQVGSVSLTMHSDECNKIAGIFMRASFRFNQHHPPGEYDVKDCKLRWVIEVNKEYFEELQEYYSVVGKYNVREWYGQWTEYVPCPHFYGDLKKASSKRDANGISEINCFFDTTSPGLEVWNCAAYLVYEHDIEQLKQIQAESQSRQFIKRYLDYYGEGAGPSREGTSNNVGVPLAHYTQRRFDSTQLHNLIEGLDLCFGIGIGNLCIVGLVALIVRRVKEASY